MLNRIKTGKCPFTGLPYDCKNCTTFKDLKFPTGPHGLHHNLDFADALTDGRHGINWLRKAVGYEHSYAEVKSYFTELAAHGATCHPIGDCDRFCFRRGCMGHPKPQNTDIGGGR